MTTQGVADVVFCVDASSSMRPCIDGVRTHIGAFVEGLKKGLQTRWDMRFDFVAHATAKGAGGYALNCRSAFHEDLHAALYLGSQTPPRLFTDDSEEFKRKLGEVTCRGDEASLIALDFALDFPWRSAAKCHRVVIFLTDEPLETGVAIPLQVAQIPRLIEKIQKLRVMLFMVAPDSPQYHELASVDKSEYEIADKGGGLARIDFAKVLAYMGKSVSAASLQAGDTPMVERGLFGQASWPGIEAQFVGE